MPVMTFLQNAQGDRIAAIHISAVMLFPHHNDDKARWHWTLRQHLLLAAELYREAQLEGEHPELGQAVTRGA